MEATKWQHLLQQMKYGQCQQTDSIRPKHKGKKGAALGLLLLSRAITEIIWQLYP